MKNTSFWGVEFWGAALTDRWKSIVDNNGVSVKAFNFDKLPESVTVAPSALSFISEPMEPTYSEGGVCFAVWKGRTQFYLSLNQILRNYNYVNQYYRKITEAAASSLTLNGKVDLFTIGQIGPALLSWGDREYIGLVVPWEIRENLAGKFIVGI